MRAVPGHGYRHPVTTTPGARPWTLAADCGGTGIKATVLDAAGIPVRARVKLRTPYPCPPDVLLAAVVNLAASTGQSFDRVSVGFPGLIRDGIVHATPHYVTEAGPFTPRLPQLEKEWAGYDVRSALENALGRPTRVLNDAEVAGLAVIDGHGFEVLFTLGTGLGCALFDDGRLLPKVEMSRPRSARVRPTTSSWATMPASGSATSGGAGGSSRPSTLCARSCGGTASTSVAAEPST